MIDYPEVGPVKSYLIYHEEEESLVENIRGLKQIRFWMTFSDNYIKHLEVLQNVGMTRIDPVEYKGTPVIPMEFLKVLLPRAVVAGRELHRQDFDRRHLHRREGRQAEAAHDLERVRPRRDLSEVGAQAVSYTTGVPPVVGAMMMFKGAWKGQACSTSSSFPPSRSWTRSASRACPGTCAS